MPDETFKKLAEISRFLAEIRITTLYGVSINEMAQEIERNTPWTSYAKRWPVLTGAIRKEVQSLGRGDTETKPTPLHLGEAETLNQQQRGVGERERERTQRSKPEAAGRSSEENRLLEERPQEEPAGRGSGKTRRKAVSRSSSGVQEGG